MITRRSAQKLLFILSADPDEIIQDITAFGEQQKTQGEILSFARLVVDATSVDVQSLAARNDLENANNSLIATEIGEILAAVNADPNHAADTLIARLKALASFVRQYDTER